MDAYEQEQADKTMLERFVTSPEFDFDATYSVDGYGKIAWYSTGYATEWTEETWEYSGEGDEEDESNWFYNPSEEIENLERVVMVMVGDDRPFTFGIDELTKLDDLDYCANCGQIGCTHDGRDRD